VFNDYIRIYNLHYNEDHIEKIEPLELMVLKAGELKYLFYVRDLIRNDL
jgi:hypothetical protein